MQPNTAEAASQEQGLPPEQAVEPEPSEAARARFDETVAHIVRVPLDQVQREVTGAAQDLARKVEDLSRIQRGVEDEMQRELGNLQRGLDELQRRAEATAAATAAELAGLRELAARLAERMDGTAAALSARLDGAVGELRQEIQQGSSQITGLGDPLRALQAEVSTLEERASTRQDAAMAGLREAFGAELVAASRRSSDADQALGRSLAQLRRTSYALLGLLIALAVAVLVITVAG